MTIAIALAVVFVIGFGVGHKTHPIIRRRINHYGKLLSRYGR